MHRTVLVVEDEPEIADIVRQYLEKDGYRVTVCLQSGTRVLSAAVDRQGAGVFVRGCERTVDAHVKNLRQKLEPDPRHPSHRIGHMMTSGLG